MLLHFFMANVFQDVRLDSRISIGAGAVWPTTRGSAIARGNFPPPFIAWCVAQCIHMMYKARMPQREGDIV